MHILSTASAASSEPDPTPAPTGRSTDTTRRMIIGTAVYRRSVHDIPAKGAASRDGTMPVPGHPRPNRSSRKDTPRRHQPGAGSPAAAAVMRPVARARTPLPAGLPHRE